MTVHASATVQCSRSATVVGGVGIAMAVPALVVEMWVLGVIAVSVIRLPVLRLLRSFHR
jgi:hypothetical protein